ncbi:hypothetical protein [Clostridium sp. Marseille-Q2269]|uniref:hypothetical protein n=1 Tax=Clostridium sp. Marseille-Q2269 TaxID=2942205 RepID=UPI002073E4DB|nr:hypothetical protein [Clostridium sp. Marseille-Q2269]
MGRLLIISWLNVKNIIHSKKFLFGIIAAFAYSMLWVLIGLFVHPLTPRLELYASEIGRFLYLIILYVSVSMLRSDIKLNTVKTVFTGIFTRIEIMISKAISLIIWGIIFFLIIEINNVLVSCILHKGIGISGFLSFNHLQLFVTYIVITFTMGSLMLLIISLIFNDKKSILFYMVFFSMVNFYTAAIPILVKRKPEMAEKFFIYMKTPFYNVVDLAQGNLNINTVLINILWGVIFFGFSMFIINRREIK